MRFLLFLIVCVAALWIGDMYFYHGRYRNELWRDVQLRVQKLDYDVRRAIGLWEDVAMGERVIPSRRTSGRNWIKMIDVIAGAVQALWRGRPG
jgi:hypothetical protein